MRRSIVFASLIPPLCAAIPVWGASTDGWGDLSASAVLGVQSEYVFRGEKRAGVSLQPGVEFGYPVGQGNAYGGLWSNQELDGGSGDEVDLYAGYALPLDSILRLFTGATYYGYNGSGGTQGPDSLEPYAGLTADLPLYPALFGYFDIEKQQLLFEVSVGDRVPFGESIALEWSLNAGGAHAERKAGVEGDSGGFWFGEASGGLVWSPVAGKRISFELNYAGREEGGYSDTVYGGVTLEVSF